MSNVVAITSWPDSLKNRERYHIVSVLIPVRHFKLVQIKFMTVVTIVVAIAVVIASACKSESNLLHPHYNPKWSGAKKTGRFRETTTSSSPSCSSFKALSEYSQVAEPPELVLETEGQKMGSTASPEPSDTCSLTRTRYTRYTADT